MYNLMVAVDLLQYRTRQTFWINLQQLGIDNGNVLAHLLSTRPNVQQLRIAALVQRWC